MDTPFKEKIEMKTTTGMKLWTIATTPMRNPYSGDRESLTTFLADIETHVSLCHMGPLMTYKHPTTGATHSLLVDPVYVTTQMVETVRQARDTSTNDDEIRLASKSGMLYLYLVNSIAGELKTNVAVQIRRKQLHEDGPTLLK